MLRGDWRDQQMNDEYQRTIIQKVEHEKQVEMTRHPQKRMSRLRISIRIRLQISEIPMRASIARKLGTVE